MRIAGRNSGEEEEKTKRSVRNVLRFHYGLKRDIIISRKGVRVLKGERIGSGLKTGPAPVEGGACFSERLGY